MLIHYLLAIEKIYTDDYLFNTLFTEARKMVRVGPLALNVFFTAAVLKHVGAKQVLNMVIPDGETDDQRTNGSAISET